MIFALGILVGVPIGALLGIGLYAYITKAEERLVAELMGEYGPQAGHRP